MDPNHSPGARELLEAQTHLYKHSMNYITSMSLNSIVQLGIPDIIHNHGNPITLHELASAVKVPPGRTGYLNRIMRLMVHSGFFATTKVDYKNQEEEEVAYILTPSSTLLLKDNSICLSPYVHVVLHPSIVASCGFLADWVQGGDGDGDDDHDKLAVYEKTNGISFWNYCGQNHKFGKMFNDAMTGDSQTMNLIIRDCAPIFEGVKSLVDVAGGVGLTAKIICEEFPHLKCTVLDLPHVVASLKETENLKYVGGDMLKSVPSGDAILLKWTLHDWSDEDCLKILKNCKEAIGGKGKGGKVIIIDSVLSDQRSNGDQESTELMLIFDIMMMALFTGKERSEKEWEKLFLDAGFSHYKIITSMFGFRSLIEVYP
ncbi:isoflavone 4'-O-methyltransferase-like [Tripterygium wilfordii]|uniref:isoflavone 4'-O-methyltransferase-like n=1 Tax=Tripterygium wilfordii TaxID=458696 RepID=UPI0018F7EBFA|nr:isoflavone 4'-O-methyltransferase-like [Tripterygium wilfordii]